MDRQLSSAPARAQRSCRPAKHSATSGAPAATEDSATSGAANRTSGNVSPTTASAAPTRLLDLLLLGLRSSALMLHLRSSGRGCGRFSLLLGLRSSGHWLGSLCQEPSKQNCSD